MSPLLRIIKKSRWYTHPQLSWLTEGEFQGNAFNDLQTQDNKLSVYEVGPDIDAERIVVALAASRDNLDRIDYAIFPDSSLATLELNATKSDGVTPDAGVNDVHYDIGELTVRHLTDFVPVIAEAEQKRMPKPRVKLLLTAAIHEGRIDPSDISGDILDKLTIH